MNDRKTNLRKDQLLVVTLFGYWLFLVVIMLAVPCFASNALNVQAGMSSVSSGRPVPAVAATYEAQSWALSATSMGVQTPIYYQSTYTAAYYWTWKPGDFMFGDIYAGIGVGAGYSERGYRASLTEKPDVKSETYLGPALRVSWRFLDPLTINLEAVYGITSEAIAPPPLTHDLVLFSIGWRL